MSSASATKQKKSATAKPKAAAKPKTTVKSATHPPFADIIRACIADSGDRSGVSRASIKKFIEEKYKMEVTPAVISNINRAIAYGANKGTFVLPKGTSGKVKLAPKKSASDAAKENTKPTKPTTTTKKSATKPASTKPAKQQAKPVKKATSATKKTTKPVTKKTTSKKTPAKKVLTGSGKGKPVTAKAKVAAKKKTTSPNKKAKAKTTTKPASNAASAKPASKK